jgi:hypothetical protein
MNKKIGLLAVLALALFGCHKVPSSSLSSSAASSSAPSVSSAESSKTSVSSHASSSSVSSANESSSSLISSSLASSSSSSESSVPVRNQFHVTFRNYDYATLDEADVFEGDEPTYNGPTPKKTSTVSTAYQFIGWDKDITAGIYEDTVFTAQFSDAVNQVKVTFRNGEEVLKEISIDYGSSAVYIGAVPQKDGDAQYRYTFFGWDKDGDGVRDELNDIEEDTVFEAVFLANVKTFSVLFVDTEGKTLQVSDVPYGGTAFYSGSAPTKTATAAYTYRFSGWDKNDDHLADPLTDILANTAFTPLFDEIPNEVKVTFLNGDGTTLQTSKIPYDGTAVYKGSTPIKAPADGWSFVFDRWERPFEHVQEDTTFKPLFISVAQTFTVTFHSALEHATLETQKNVAYGSYVHFTGKDPSFQTSTYQYTFTGWDKDPATTKIIDDTVFEAVFAKTPLVDKQFTIALNAEGNGYDLTGYIATEEYALVTVPAFYQGIPVTGILETAFDSSVNALVDKITEVVLPATLKTVADNVFANAASLSSIEVASDSTAFETIDGVLYSKDGTTLISCPNALVGSPFALPKEVTVIGAKAFDHCKKVTAITVPTDTALTTIQTEAFNFSGLTSFSVPSTVTSIASDAFLWAFDLTAINVDSANTVYESIAGVLFDKAGATLLCVPEGKTGDYAIPEGTVALEAYALASSVLTSLTLPSTLTTIHDDVFINNGHKDGTSYLSWLIVPDTVTTIKEASFGEGFATTETFRVYFAAAAKKDGYSDHMGTVHSQLFYYSETLEDGAHWHYDTDGKTPVVKTA